MARINVEDSIWQDIRFIKLMVELGNPDLALGAIVRAWILAQKWYLTDNKMIPINEWNEAGFPAGIIAHGLAEIIDGYVRLSGAEKQFAWLTQRSIAGRKGGQATAKRPLSDRLATGRRTEASYSFSSSSFANAQEEVLNRLHDEKKTSGPTPKTLFDLWNQNRGPLPQCVKLSEGRAAKCRTQIAINGDEKHWLDVLSVWKNSVFCTTEWLPSFDDWLSEAKRIRTLEGKYNNRQQAPVGSISGLAKR